MLIPHDYLNPKPSKMNYSDVAKQFIENNIQEFINILRLEILEFQYKSLKESSIFSPYLLKTFDV